MGCDKIWVSEFAAFCELGHLGGVFEGLGFVGEEVFFWEKKEGEVGF